MAISNVDERIEKIRAALKAEKKGKSKNAGSLPVTDGSVIEDVTYADLTNSASPAPEKPKVIDDEVRPLLITNTRDARQKQLEKEITERLKRNLAPGAESLPELDGDEEGKKNQGKSPKFDEPYSKKLEKKQENQRLKQEESDRVKKNQEATVLQLDGENEEFIDLLSDHNNLKFNGDFGYLSDQEKILEQIKTGAENRKAEEERKKALEGNAKRRGEVLRIQREETKKQKIEQTKEKIIKVNSLQGLFELGCGFLNLTEQSKKDEFRDKICNYVYRNKIREKPELIEIEFYDKLNEIKKEFNIKLETIPKYTSWEELNKYIVLEIQKKIFLYPEHKEINLANFLSEEELEEYWAKYIPEKYIESIRKLKKQDAQYNSISLRKERVQDSISLIIPAVLDQFKEEYQEEEVSEKDFRYRLGLVIREELSEAGQYFKDKEVYKKEYAQAKPIPNLTFKSIEYSDFDTLFDEVVSLVLDNLKTDYLREEEKKIRKSINNSQGITPEVEKRSLGNFGIIKEKKIIEVDYQPTISFNDYLRESQFFTQLRESKIKGDIQKFTGIIIGPISSDILEKGKMVVELFDKYYSVKKRSDMRMLARNLFNYKPTK